MRLFDIISENESLKSVILDVHMKESWSVLIVLGANIVPELW
jgi:hypothetical protein